MAKLPAALTDDSPPAANDVLGRQSDSDALADQYHLALEAAPIGILIVGTRGEIRLVNRQIERLFGYDRHELLGQPLEVLLPERFRHKHLGMKMAFLKEPGTRDMGYGRDLFGLRKDGTEFAVEIGLNPSDNNRDPLVLASIVDVTARKTQETEISRRVHDLERYKVEMGLMSEMSSLLQHALDHDEAYGIVATFGENLLPCDTGTTSVALYTRRAAQTTLERTGYWGTVLTDRLEPHSCWALRRSQVHYGGRPTAESPSFPRCSHSPPSGWSLCVPMSANGQALGVVVLSGQEELTPAARSDKERVARAVADHLALAINNLDLRQSLRDLAIRDPLSGLFNRRYMVEAMTREYARAKRQDSPLSILMLDLDHFKRFNDTRGHQAADECLASVGQLLRTHFRESDIVCRYGGEEFLVAMPDCTKANAVDQANHLCERFRAAGFGLTVSIGVAEYPNDGQTWEGTLLKADGALYQAKAKGRDQVSAAD